MALLVLAYPELNDKDYQVIQNFRKSYDERYFNIVEPHFTLVFPVSNISENTLIDEINVMTDNAYKFEVALRCASISKDAFSDYYHIFLLPDEGNSNIVKMHNTLYSGALQNQWRLDLDYIPHIGIGNSKYKEKCLNGVEIWNKADFTVHGSVNKLTVVRFENNVVSKIQEISLRQNRIEKPHVPDTDFFL